MEPDPKGYTLRHRKRWDKNYHLDRLRWILMDWFIDHAVYEDTIVNLPGKRPIKLKRGQVIFSERKLAKFFKVGRRRIRTARGSMILSEFLTQETTQGISIATITNYNKYQFKPSGCDPASDPEATHGPTHVPLNKYNKYNKEAHQNDEKKQIQDAAKRRVEATKEYLESVKSIDPAVDVKAKDDLKAKLRAKAKDQAVNFKI
jgi:hypothetical protein